MSTGAKLALFAVAAVVAVPLAMILAAVFDWSGDTEGTVAGVTGAVLWVGTVVLIDRRTKRREEARRKMLQAIPPVGTRMTWHPDNPIPPGWVLDHELSDDVPVPEGMVKSIVIRRVRVEESGQ